MITKHYELYQPRLVKQLAKMKRSCAHLTVSVRRLTEETQKQTSENDLLWRELSDANPDAAQRIRKQLAFKDAQIGGIKNSRGWRLLTYVRRARQSGSQFLRLWKNHFRKELE